MESIDLDDDPIKVVKEAIALNLNGTNSNPILKEWYNKDFSANWRRNFMKRRE